MTGPDPVYSGESNGSGISNGSHLHRAQCLSVLIAALAGLRGVRKQGWLICRLAAADVAMRGGAGADRIGIGVGARGHGRPGGAAGENENQSNECQRPRHGRNHRFVTRSHIRPPAFPRRDHQLGGLQMKTFCADDLFMVAVFPEGRRATHIGPQRRSHSQVGRSSRRKRRISTWRNFDRRHVDFADRGS